jgi:ABC-type transport system involved in multi-copper enzyme maturation permease subunit
MNGFGGLLVAELHRAYSRRLLRLLLVIALAFIALISVIGFFETTDDPTSGLADATAEVEQCKQDQERFARAGERIECPTLEEARDAHDERFIFASEMPEITRGVAIPLFGLALIIAASFVGAEWGAGTMTTLLTWEPRRGRVLAAKTIASAAVAALTVVSILVLVDIVWFVIAATRGVTEGTAGSTWWTLAGVWLRAAALAVFGATLGVGLATYTRNTAGAIGIGLGYTLILDNVIGFWRDGQFRDWLFQENFTRLLGMPVEVDPVTFEQAVLSPVRPLILLAIYGVGVVLLAYAIFRRRDVT